ncbi:MAG: hypothetical protein QOJ67_3743 [Acidimicrobiaceae bacterium]
MGYLSSWDRPHAPGRSTSWQESDCYWFFDASAGVGGFHRIGQSPNSMAGLVTLFVFATGGERYRAHRHHTVGSDDRSDVGHRVGSHSAESLGDRRMRFAWEEVDCAGALEFYESFYAPRDWSTTGHSDRLMQNLNPDGHLECSGRVRGTVRIAERCYDIDALAHRDRSWGERDVSRVSMHRYRMFSGTVGPELSFATFLLDLKGGPPMIAGFVVRDGVEHDVRDLRVLTTFDADGLTPVSAVALLTLETGESLRIPSAGVQGFVTPVPEAQAVCSDTISTIAVVGRPGFCDLELSNNPGRGTYVPTQDDVTLLAVDSGVSPSACYELLQER